MFSELGKHKIKYGKCDFTSFTNEWNLINLEKFEGYNIEKVWNFFSDQY